MYGVPRWTHDCDACTFLGRYRNFDLYFCAQRSEPTVIARFGNHGADYQSGLVAANYLPQLREARSRATARGLLYRHL